MKSFQPRVSFGRKILMTILIYLMVIELFRLSISSWIRFDQSYFLGICLFPLKSLHLLAKKSYSLIIITISNWISIFETVSFFNLLSNEFHWIPIIVSVWSKNQLLVFDPLYWSFILKFLYMCIWAYISLFHFLFSRFLFFYFF